MAARRSKGGTGKAGKPAKKPIEQYQHPDEQRANNPHVGLVRPENDPDTGRRARRTS